jgi:lipoyl synthase
VKVGLPRTPGRPSERHALKVLLRQARLHTVCEEARCPNAAECFGAGTATFLILGDVCTRACRFCAIARGRPPAPPDPEEPERVAAAVARLGLRHAVVTSVTRDDLEDGGAAAFAATVRAIRARCPETRIEVLVPDLGGLEAALELVLAAGPEVLNHNVETVARLYPRARPGATLARSLELLARAARHARAPVVKSGLMVGLGEEDAEVLELLGSLQRAGCQLVTIGQYLQPRRDNLPVARQVEESAYALYRERGRSLGLRVLAGPLVRSSYHARETLQELGAGG